MLPSVKIGTREVEVRLLQFRVIWLKKYSKVSKIDFWSQG